MLDLVRSLYSYNAWANQRILQAAAPLTFEQLTGLPCAGLPPLRDTMVHLIGAQWIWLQRWKGTSPTALFDPGAFPNLEMIQARWEAIEAETQQFLDHLSPQMLPEVVRYRNTRGEAWAYPLWQQLVHQVNHATQHRSEAAASLTHFGYSPGDLDYLVYQDGLSSG